MSGLRWVTASRAIAQLFTWASTFVVIRLLSPTEFGLASLAGLFASFLLMLNELGFSVALVQRQTRDPETLTHAFGALLAIGLLMMLGLMAVAPVLGALVKEPRVVPLLRFISLQFVAMAFGVIPQARLSMDMRFKEISITSVSASLAGAAMTLISALKGAGAWSLIIGIVGMSFVRSIMLNVYSPWIVIPKLKLAKIRDFAGFSGLVVLERTLWYWYMQIDSLVVARVLGAGELGIYSVARQLTNIPLERAMVIVNSVTLPAYSLVKHDLEQVGRGYLKVLRVGAGYAFPVFWGLAAVSEPTVRLLIGAKWIAAVPVIQILCISMPLRMLNSFTSAAAQAVARQDVNIKSLLIAIVVIPAGVAIGSRWGMRGVAAAWAVGFPVVYFFNAMFLREALTLQLRRMIDTVRPAGIAAGIMLLVLELMSRAFLDSLAPAAHLAIAVPTGALLFATALWFVSKSCARELLDFARAVISRDAPAGLKA